MHLLSAVLFLLNIAYHDTCSSTSGAREIDQYCQGVCATLHLYDENDVLLCTARGSNPRMRVRGVVKVQTVGDYGCYTIFKKNNYKSTSLCWNHTDRLNIMEADYPYSIVRYVFMIQNI